MILKTVLRGFIMGSADMIPGISGGTVALIFGFYSRLIHAICSFDSIWLKAICRFDLKGIWQRPDWSFMVPLGSGLVVAIVIFTKVIPLPFFLQTYPNIVYGLLCGLISGSVVHLLRQAKLQSFKEWRWVIAGVALGHLLLSIIPIQTPDANWFIFLSGMLSISAMLLPGISGTLILLMLKKYAYIFEAVGHFNLAVILPFLLGVIAGLIAFSRILAWLLQHWKRQTLAFSIGLLISSLWALWPFQERIYTVINGKQKLVQLLPFMPENFSVEIVITLSMIMLGLLIAFALHCFSLNGITSRNRRILS